MHIKEDTGEEPKIMPAVAISSGSEFMEACQQANPAKLWPIIDELMTDIKIMNPRLYDATLDSIRSM